MSKHTPGPWTAEDEGASVHIAGHDGIWVAEVYGIDDNANARLIAAAPDLLQALTEVVETYDSGDNGRTLRWAVDTCRDAIAKATGDTHA
jgi:hypothetical protein